MPPSGSCSRTRSSTGRRTIRDPLAEHVCHLWAIEVHVLAGVCSPPCTVDPPRYLPFAAQHLHPLPAHLRRFRIPSTILPGRAATPAIQSEISLFPRYRHTLVLRAPTAQSRMTPYSSQDTPRVRLWFQAMRNRCRRPSERHARAAAYSHTRTSLSWTWTRGVPPHPKQAGKLKPDEGGALRVKHVDIAD